MKMPWRMVRYLSLAKRVIRQGRLPAVLMAVARKRSAKGGLLKGLAEDLELFQALCIAWWKGEYRHLGKPALVAVVAALLYFLAPLDVIPDWIPGLGFLDDLAVLGWVMRTWADELEAFRQWRDRQPAARRKELLQLPSIEDRPPPR